MSLPKIISQETFDQVVLENVVDFDKSLPEAIVEAAEEFKAQGVLLTTIIKDLHLSLSNDAIIHPVLESLSNLKQYHGKNEVNRATPSASSEVMSFLNTMTTECKLSLPHRVLASKNGAYEELLKLIDSSRNESEVLSAAVFAMQALTDGNPDILTPEGIKVMIELMEQYQSDLQSEVMEALAKWCLCSKLKHEANRAAIFTAGIPHFLVLSLNNVSAVPHKARIIATLKAIRGFTLDDDIRAEFGKAHENCRHLVEEEGLLQMALEILMGCLASDSGAVAGECLSTISSICVRAEYCQQACDADALGIINGILENFPNSPILTKQSITLMSTLAGDDKVKFMVMKTNAPHLIAQAFDKHQMHVGVCSACCSAVSMLALREPKHAALLVQCGAAGGVLQAMKQHPKDKQLQKLGCLAVRNLCCRNEEISSILREYQAEELVKNAVAVHGDDLKDMAKSALRDMGADVVLEEVWHGKGHEIDQ